MKKILKIAVFFIGFNILFSCSRDCEIEYLYEGVIIDGFSCGFVVSTTQGNFIPINIDQQFQTAGLKVRLNFKLTGESQLCPGFVGNAQKMNIINIEKML